MMRANIWTDPRTLEHWRRWWRRAESEGRPDLRKGSRFGKVGSRLSQTVSDPDEFLAAHVLVVGDESQLRSASTARGSLGVPACVLTAHGTGQQPTNPTTRLRGSPCLG